MQRNNVPQVQSTSLEKALPPTTAIVGAGSGAGAGAGIGLLAGGPPGAAIGAAIGGGISLIAGLIAGITLSRKLRRDRNSSNRALEERDRALEKERMALEEKDRALERERTALEEKDRALDGERTAIEKMNQAVKDLHEHDPAIATRDALINMLKAKYASVVGVLEEANAMLKKMVIQLECEKESNATNITAILQRLNMPLPVKTQEQKEGEINEHRGRIEILEKAEAALEDALSLEIMEDPIIADDGNLYDRSFLQKHYNAHIENKRQPMCPKNPNQILSDPSKLEISTHALDAIEILAKFKKSFCHLSEFKTGEMQFKKEIKSLNRDYLPLPKSKSIPLSNSSSTSTTISSLSSSYSPGIFSFSPEPEGQPTSILTSSTVRSSLS